MSTSTRRFTAMLLTIVMFVTLLPANGLGEIYKATSAPTDKNKIRLVRSGEAMQFEKGETYVFFATRLSRCYE